MPSTCLDLAPDIQKVFLNVENVLLKGQIVCIVTEGLLNFHRHVLLHDHTCAISVSLRLVLVMWCARAATYEVKKKVSDQCFTENRKAVERTDHRKRNRHKEA